MELDLKVAGTSAHAGDNGDWTLPHDKEFVWDILLHYWLSVCGEYASQTNLPSVECQDTRMEGLFKWKILYPFFPRGSLDMDMFSSLLALYVIVTYFIYYTNGDLYGESTIHR